MDPNEAIRRESMQQYGFGTEAMKDLKVCEKCGAVAAARDRVCSECHARLPQDTMFLRHKRRHAFCPRCDTIVSDAARYCPQCGRRLRREPLQTATL